MAFLAGILATWGLPPGPNPLWTILGAAIWLRLLERTPHAQHDGGQSPTQAISPTKAFQVRRGARLGFMFGLGHFLFGLDWLWTSLHIYGKIPAPAAMLVILLLAAILAIYPAIFGALQIFLVARPLFLLGVAPALWVLTEWLRAHLFSGFFWNPLGQTWDGAPVYLQLADLGGVYLLSALTLFLAAVLAWFSRPANWRRRRQVGLVLLLTLVVCGAGYGYGSWRMKGLDASLKAGAASGEGATGEMLRVALVQGNIAQDLKWVPERQKEWLERYLDQTLALEQEVDLVVWPETAAAFFLQGAPRELERIVDVSRAVRAPILTGAPMAERAANREWRFFNSMVIIGAEETGAFEYRYDKHHLVPFGEYIPLRFLVPDSVHKLTHGSKDFTPGPGPALLGWEMGDIGPLICYEVIFPDEVRQLARQGARWLINLTNDGWFGESAKPQHLSMARMRAVENRLPMIRVANSGISAVIDPLGRELGRIPSNEQGSLVITLAAGPGGSIWSGYGHLWMPFWAGVSFVFWVAGRRLNARTAQNSV
ncbi:MAG: apolipoprotein N-acyltransferase [Magnetococcales bacterium]|nr:apolipoprotein N-acyltransferase [Magnetococcales bacterium]